MEFYIATNNLPGIQVDHPDVERALQLYIQKKNNSETLLVEIPMDANGDMHGLDVVG